MNRRRFVVTLTAGVPAPALAGQAVQPASGAADEALSTDPILNAIAQEIARFRKGASLGETPYFVEVSVEDAELFSVSASLGALFPPTSRRVRPVRAGVRVGGAEFDNTNSIYSDYSSATRYDSGRLALDNNVLALRHELWLALDRAYRTAVESIGRKRAALRGITVTEPLPDFWPGQPLTVVESPHRYKLEPEYWKDRVRRLSSVFAADPATTQSSVEFDASFGLAYHVDSTPVVCRTSDAIAVLRARGVRQAPDGMLIYDGVMLASLDPEKLPGESAQQAAVEQVARNVRELAAAPVGEAYDGPLLFEGAAAAQILAQIWGEQLGLSRKPVSDPNRPINILTSELETRLGGRVLPEWISLTDDPALLECGGVPLIGGYKVDLDGIAAQRVELVKDGVLKSLLVSRQPVRGVGGPNGHARLPGALGVKGPRISNLILTARDQTPDEELRKKLLQMAAQSGRPYAIVIRKVDFPSFAPAEELRRIGQRSARGGGRVVAPPLLVYRLYADGREQLIRGVRFRGLNLRSFRDITAAGTAQHVHSYIDNGAPLAIAGAGNFVIGCSVVAPSLLFEEVELEAAADDLAKPPVVPPPAAV